MYRIFDNQAGKYLPGEYLTWRAAEIRRNAQCMLPSDWLRFEIRYRNFDFRTGVDRNV